MLICLLSVFPLPHTAGTMRRREGPALARSAPTSRRPSSWRERSTTSRQSTVSVGACSGVCTCPPLGRPSSLAALPRVQLLSALLPRRHLIHHSAGCPGSVCYGIQSGKKVSHQVGESTVMPGAGWRKPQLGSSRGWCSESPSPTLPRTLPLSLYAQLRDNSYDVRLLVVGDWGRQGTERQLRVAKSLDNVSATGVAAAAAV